jgi:thioredoxin-like negative regulator of GroEL
MSQTTRDRPHRLESKADLNDLLAAHDRVLVEFHTEGCSMCAAMVPVLGAVAKVSDVPVATMNPRDDPHLVAEYAVRSVPKLLLFEDGELVKTLEDGFVRIEGVLSFIGD